MLCLNLFSTASGLVIIFILIHDMCHVQNICLFSLSKICTMQLLKSFIQIHQLTSSTSEKVYHRTTFIYMNTYIIHVHVSVWECFQSQRCYWFKIQNLFSCNTYYWFFNFLIDVLWWTFYYEQSHFDLYCLPNLGLNWSCHDIADIFLKLLLNTNQSI